MRKKLNVLIASIALVVLIGCASRLQPGGAYAPTATNTITGVVTPLSQPDMAFYVTDAAYAACYATINGIFDYERSNRTALWAINPNIKQTLDRIRPQAWDANVQYHKARAEYKKIPVPANLTVLQQCLAKAQQLLATTQAVLPKVP